MRQYFVQYDDPSSAHALCGIMLPLIGCYIMWLQHGMRCVLCCDFRGEKGSCHACLSVLPSQLQTTNSTSNTADLWFRLHATYVMLHILTSVQRAITICLSD